MAFFCGFESGKAPADLDLADHPTAGSIAPQAGLVAGPLETGGWSEAIVAGKDEKLRGNLDKLPSLAGSFIGDKGRRPLRGADIGALGKFGGM